VSRRGSLRSAAGGEAAFSRLERAALGLEAGTAGAAYVALKYYRPEHECFSEWRPDELRAFSGFCRRMSQLTWQQIVQTGGRHKSGLAWTPVRRDQLPPVRFLDAAVSEDVSWVELRVTQAARVFGFRARQAFFLVFLDRGHRILRG
jgi:hypothetical protein